MRVAYQFVGGRLRAGAASNVAGGGGSVTLGPWVASPDATGYVIGYGPTSNAYLSDVNDQGYDPNGAFNNSLYPNTIDVGNVLTYTFAPGAGTWYFSIRAYDADGPSVTSPWALSDETTRTV